MSDSNQTLVSYQLVSGGAHVQIANPPVNALSQGVRQGLLETLDRAVGDEASFILLTCMGKSFIAGADIREIGLPPKKPFLPEIMDRLDRSPIPVVAAIQGSALGGGLEIALACHYRLALADARFGLPEVKLGIIPGAGGTQRLPRLIGITPALDMISTAKTIDSAAALDLGLLDAVLNENLVESAQHWCRQNVLERETHPRVSDIELKASVADREALAIQRKRANRKPEVLAPGYVCDAIEAAFELDFRDGLAKERSLFSECRDSPQSAAFRHLFFAEREASKLKRNGQSTALQIQSVAVVGGGTMGRGIAISLLDAGLSVKLLEVSEESATKARDALVGQYEGFVRRRRLSEKEMEIRLAAIEFITDYSLLRDSDLIIEAVFEDMDVKLSVFKALDKVCKPSAILASNTSFLDINQLAKATSRPESVIGLHYFSPANVMKLLEVIPGDSTSDEVVNAALKLGKVCGKISVISGVCYGFIGNRINRRLQQQAQHCLLEGATPTDIDKAMEDFGMAMGPLAVSDLAGLDIGYMARKALTPEQRGDPKTYWIPDKLAEQGRHGQKSGMGYYRYKQDTRRRLSDSAVLELISSASTHFGYRPATLESKEIVERLLLCVVNEAAKVLEDGIASRSGDIDVVYVHGYGFPAHRGGILYWADKLGMATVREKLLLYWQKTGDNNLRPAQLISDLAESGQGFSDFSPN